ncbi:MAG: DUF1294 domain-containing protein [Eubacterium sp.]
MEGFKLILFYFAAISLITVIVTAADKMNSKTGRRRVPEDFLLTLAILGGAGFEYLTMKIIRHKTRHKKFMAGLPVLFVLQIVLIAILYIYTQRG